jgi:hypothetical protein
MPKLVFWNVASRNIHTPAIINDKGVLLLSGSSPICLKIALQATGEGIKDVVKEIVDSPRYKVVE